MTNSDYEMSLSSCSIIAEDVAQAEKNGEKFELKKPKKQETNHHINWSTTKYFPLLVKNIKKKIELRKLFVNPPIAEDGTFVPHTTLNSALIRLKGKEPTLNKLFPLKKQSLLESK